LTQDEWLWTGDESQLYLVKSTYKTLKTTGRGENADLCDLLWKVKALPTAQHFI